MALIRWLHISDLHLGSEGAETNMMRDELLPYLKGMGLSWDYVFFTGDIRTANADPKDFTDEMAAYLKGVCDAVGVPMEKLFIVPGNHDVDRDVVGRDDAIKRMMFEGKGYYFQGDGNIKQEDMDAIMAGEADFKAFLGKFYDDERLKKYGNPQVGENDRGAIQYVIKQSCEAKRLSYQNHPELNKGNADFEFVEFCIVPVLMAALGQQLRGDDTGSQMIRQMLDEYQPLNEPEMFDKVKAVFERVTYDSTLIVETNRLNANDYYAVYICAYLLTAFSSDASYAFSLLIAIMPVLEKQLIQILGEEVRSIVNRFIGDFWRAKILTALGEFEGYQHLRDKGLPLIESYEGKTNQANHTMLVVSNHVKLTNGLTTEQEQWMDE